MNDPYSILGISKNASDDEVKEAYRALVRKYHPDNYGEDNPLKDLATEKMQAVNAAYDQICREREGRKNTYGGSGTYYESYSGSGADDPVYREIRTLLNSRRFSEADKRLQAIPEGERVAQWHYLKSIVLMRRGHKLDAMRELEIACSMEPDNLEFQKAKEMFNGSGAYGSTYYGTDDRYGRRSRDSDVCDTCMNLMLCDCLCECLGGDLIPCL